MFIFIFSFNFSLAKDIEFNFPSEIKVNEEFTANVKLIDFPKEKYDLKIDILNQGERIAQIFDGNKWKSTNFYVNNAFEDENSEIKLKITSDFNGMAEIIVKVRKNGGSTSTTFNGYKINVKSEEKTDVKNKENTSINELFEDERKENLIQKTENEDKSNEIKSITSDENNVIVLSPQNIKTDYINNKKVIFKSKNEIIKSYAIYGFAVFCILIIILPIIGGKANE